MFNGSKVYVAGHTGLLGSALIKRLAGSGCSDVLTSRHASLDLRVQASVDEFFRKNRPEYVFLCAGLTGGIIANKTRPAEFLHTNLAIQENVFEAARKYDVKRLVFYGSSCVYPRECAQPMKESHFLTGTVEPTSEAYATAKIAGINACKEYNREDNVQRFIALLPNSMYGPNDNFDVENSHVLAALISRFSDAVNRGDDTVVLWGSGTPRREFIFSSDVADASIFAVENAERLENSHYNIGTGVEYSIKELAGIVAGITGFKGAIEWDTTKPDGTPRKLLDSSRFETLGWSPSTDLEHGLKATCEWYRENATSVRRAACR